MTLSDALWDTILILLGVSGMVCNLCGGDCDFSQIDGDYVTSGKCRDCYLGYGKR